MVGRFLLGAREISGKRVVELGNDASGIVGQAERAPHPCDRSSARCAANKGMSFVLDKATGRAGSKGIGTERHTVLYPRRADWSL